MPIGKDEILKRFGHHPGTELTIPQHNELREIFIDFALWLDSRLPDGRAKSLAFTAFQETTMWSNFSIAEQAPVVLPDPQPNQPKLF